MTNENPATIELGDALVSAEQSKSRRKRLIAQTAAGAMLGAVVITGAFTVLPGLFSQDEAVSAGSGGLAVVPAAAPASSAPAEAAPQRPNQGPGISDKEEKALDKYFAAGYELGDAQKLAKIWKLHPKELLEVKAIAGQKLLDGEKLPIKPEFPPAPPQSSDEQKQVNAFFEKGYDYDDAQKLAKLWKKPTPYDAKVEGGKKILAGETLPLKP